MTDNIASGGSSGTELDDLVSQSCITFLHPDLGIGGAEKAIVDSACGLQDCGFNVRIVTNHHDPQHCFPETRDGTLRVHVVGSWLPRSIFGRFQALCAYLRFLYAACYIILSPQMRSSSLLFLDQISAPIPLLKWFKFRVLFYCHFPDMLLTHRTSFMKRMYRAPLDWLEEYSTGKADRVLVNSKFTADIFHHAFKSLGHVEPIVVYPVPNLNNLDVYANLHGAGAGDQGTLQTLLDDPHNILFVSINRYERKKNIPLALRSMRVLMDHLVDDPATAARCHLVVAGGYDVRVVENVEHYEELRQLAANLKIEKQVVFLRSCSDATKVSLMQHATALLYTPSHEHFGIVPVEAMYLRCPVIAVNSGGPCETVSNDVTGFLCEPQPEDFAVCMERLLHEESLRRQLGNQGNARVLQKFAYSAFKVRLRDIICELLAS